MQADDFQDDDDQDDGYIDAQAVPKLREQLKAEKAAKKELAARASAGEQAVRELAFLKAGVEVDKLNDDQQQALNALIGDNYDPEHVRAKAQALNIVQPADTPQTQALEAHQQMSQMAQGGVQVAPADDYRNELAQAKSVEEVLDIERRHGRVVEYDQPSTPLMPWNALPNNP